MFEWIQADAQDICLCPVERFLIIRAKKAVTAAPASGRHMVKAQRLVLTAIPIHVRRHSSIVVPPDITDMPRAVA